VDVRNAVHGLHEEVLAVVPFDKLDDAVRVCIQHLRDLEQRKGAANIMAKVLHQVNCIPLGHTSILESLFAWKDAISHPDVGAVPVVAVPLPSGAVAVELVDPQGLATWEVEREPLNWLLFGGCEVVGGAVAGPRHIACVGAFELGHLLFDLRAELILVPDELDLGIHLSSAKGIEEGRGLDYPSLMPSQDLKS